MITSIENQTIALSGLFLATELVQTIANTGQYNEGNMRIALESLFNTDPDTVESVYGSVNNLRPGQKRLVDQLGGTDSKPNMQITQYTLTLLKLENKCHSQPQVMERISRGIDGANTMRSHYDTLDTEIIALLAKIYTDNVSDIAPRVVVHGNREYLEQETHANCIRACLLAGLRAAVLWRQCGGSRWKIVSGRQRYVNQASKNLSSI